MDISAPCTNDTLFPIVTTMSDDDGAVDYSLQVSAMVADHEEQTEMAIEESLQETRQEKFSDNGGVGLPCDKWNSCSDSLLNDIILSFVRLYYLHATKLFLVSKQWNRIYRLRCLKEPTDLLIFLFPENWEINHLLWRCPLTLRQLEKRMKTVDSMTLTFDQRHVEKSPFDIVADSLASLLRCRLWTVLNCYMSPFDDQTQRIVPVKAYHSKLCSSKKSFIIPPPYCEIVLLTPNFRQFHHIKCYMSVWKPEYRKYEYEEIPVPQGKEPRTGAAAYSLMNSNGAFYHEHWMAMLGQTRKNHIPSSVRESCIFKQHDDPTRGEIFSHKGGSEIRIFRFWNQTKFKFFDDENYLYEAGGMEGLIPTYLRHTPGASSAPLERTRAVSLLLSRIKKMFPDV